MKTKHTRGKWSANNCTIWDASKNPIAYTGAMADQSLEHLEACAANARLIAAAPELLEALKLALTTINDPLNGLIIGKQVLVEEIEKAINKAEGGES